MDESKPRPAASLNGAKWIASDARKLMAQDIIDGFIPTEGKINSKEIYDTLYRDHPFFANFPFDKVRYDNRLKTLRNQVGSFKRWADFDSKAIEHDLQIYPHQNDIRGEPRWEGSEAQALLIQDVANKVHVGKKPSELQMMEGREAYQQFSLKKFRKHLDQLQQDEKVYVDNGHKYTKNVIGNEEFSRIH